jgi:hypothetical protein
MRWELESGLGRVCLLRLNNVLLIRRRWWSDEEPLGGVADKSARCVVNHAHILHKPKMVS